jgi:predicted ArsR family transcriptional regulator
MPLPTDAELNAIGVLKRRLIEARVLAPMLEAMSERFGRDAVQEIARSVIIALAEAQGAQLANAVGGCSLAHFEGSLDRWQADDALQIAVQESTSERFAFNVTRCRYAEMYRELGIPELGAILSCNRDAALMDGFNPNVAFTRTQTIMGGATHCDFVYTLTRAPRANE